ncbi:toast rack family protein [Peijinzhouia sedimentorum]
MKKSLPFLVGSLLIGGLFSCEIIVNEGKLMERSITNNNSIDIGANNRVKAYIEMNAGELRIEPGTSKLVEGEFTYNMEDYTIDLDYVEEDSEVGELHITGGGNNNKWVFNREGGKTENAWNLKINEDIEFELNVELKAGLSNINIANSNVKRLYVDAAAGKCEALLGDSSLEFLDINSTAGKVEADFRGDWKQTIEAEINTTLGAVEIWLPNTVNVEMTTSTNLGDVEAGGLTKRGGIYEYRSNTVENPVTIYLTVKNTIGKIQVHIEEVK